MIFQKIASKLILALALVASSAAHAQAGGPFSAPGTCPSDLFQTRQGTGGTSLQRFPASALTTGGGAVNVYGALQAIGVNGLAYNSQDGFMYGLDTRTGPARLVRLGSSGIQPVGTISTTGAQSPALPANFVPTGATFDKAGRYYFAGQGGAGIVPAAIYRVDTIPASGPVTVANVYALSTAVSNVGDIAFGPDGNLYGATGSTLYQMILSGTSATVNTRALATAVPGIGSAFFNDAGSFFVYENGTGKLTEIRFPFGAAFATGSANVIGSVIFSGAAPVPSSTSSSDGAACVVFNNSNPTVSTITLAPVVAPGQTITGTVTCQNNGPSVATGMTCGATTSTPGAAVIVGACTPTSPNLVLATSGANTIVCNITVVPPSTLGGTDTVPTSVVVNGTTSATNEPAGNAGNNSLVVTIPIIDAVNDVAPAPVSSATGGVAIVNVLANDGLGSVAATTATVSLSQVSTTNAGVTLNTTTGAVSVAPGTPPGSYTVTYQICALAPNQTVCDSAADTVVVSASVLPVTDSGTVPAGVTSTAIVNIAANDSVNGSPASLGASGNATIAAASLPSGLSLNTATGAVTVAPSVAPGTYTFSYVLCDKSAPPNCAVMTDTVVVSAAKGAISGVAWIDASGNGVLDAGELRVPGLRVGIFTTNASGVRTEVTNPAARPTTDANGAYRIPDLPSSDAGGPTYEVVFFNEAGAAILGTPRSMSGTGNDGTVPSTLDRIIGVKVSAGGETVLQNLPLDPSGVVYDSVTRRPVPGAVVTFTGPPGFNPAIHLVGGAANASQTTGSSGFYQFLLLPGAPAGTYGLSVTPPPSYILSTSIPAQAGPFPSAGPAGGTNPVVPNTQAPQIATNDPTTYYLAFTLIPGTSADVIHNHIPLDPGAQPKLGISKVVNKAAGEIGDTVLYTVKLRNIGQTVVPAGVSIIDRLPAGFKYMLGTSQAAVPGTVMPTAIADPSGGVGAVLGYTTTEALPVGAEYAVQYRVRIGVGAQQGDGINRVQAKFGALLSNEAQAKVRVMDGVFTSDACVAGKVFVDCNNNHVQNAEELGVPGVRLYMEDGTYFITDSEGKYSYCGIAPKSHVISVDMLTMPRGSRMTTTSNRNLGDGNSIFLDVKNGQLSRADFAEGSCSNTVLEQVKARRTQGEVRSTETEKTGQPALKFEGKSPFYPQQGTDGANQPLVVPRPPNGGASSSPEQNTPVPQLPGASSNTQGANLRNAK
jgi:large repetitive protein